MFEVFAKQYSESFKKLYIEHIGALNENNYSMQESSKRLYIHKAFPAKYHIVFRPPAC